MPASFDEKVEALRRLREKRQQRQAAAAAAAPTEAVPVAVATPAADRPAAGEAGGGLAAELAAAVEAGGRALAAELAASPAPSATPPRLDPCDNGGAGEVDALFCAGHCLERGLHGMEADPRSAAALYREAAEQGHAVAQWRLGELSEFGRGVPQCDDEAARWYQKAAEAGSAPARVNLALFLEAGRGGLAQDDTAAAKWHLMAAEAGHALGQFCAAKCLLEGRGVERDAEEARQWLLRSAAAGFRPAAEELASLDAKGGQGARDDASDSDGGRAGDLLELLGAGQRDGLEATSSLTSLASRLAEHLKHLGDEEAEAVLDELMRDIAAEEDLEDDIASESESEEIEARRAPLRSALCSAEKLAVGGYPAAAAA